MDGACSVCTEQAYRGRDGAQNDLDAILTRSSRDIDVSLMRPPAACMYKGQVASGTRREARTRPVRASAGSSRSLGPLAVSGVLVSCGTSCSRRTPRSCSCSPSSPPRSCAGDGVASCSAVVAALCFDFFFTRPYYSFTINRRDDVETTVVLLVVGLVVGELVVRAWRSRDLASDAADARSTRSAASPSSPRAEGPTGRLITIVEREVVELLGARGARFERPPFPTSLPRLGHGKVTIGGGEECDALVPHGPAERGRSFPCGARARDRAPRPRAPRGLHRRRRCRPDDRALAVALVDQLGAVLAAAGERGDH